MLARARIELDITIIDHDRVELSNLHRQVLYRDGDAAHEKAICAARSLRTEAASHGIELTTSAIQQRFDAENALSLVRSHDLVLEGTDNHETKFLVADACVMSGVPLVQAGVVGWSGWVLATRPHESACLRCVFEEIPSNTSIATCTNDGVLGAAVGIIGSLEAALAIQLLEGKSAGALLRYDVLTGSARASRLERRSDCALCGLEPTIRGIQVRPTKNVCPQSFV
jgi:molybdopterin/thiamine biosynthesis adenylyltransferase